MKRLISYFLAVVFSLALCLFLGPAAFAQHHGEHGGGGSHVGGGHEENHGGGGHEFHSGGQRGEDRHWGEHHFDNDYRGRYFGDGHRFRLGSRYAWGNGYRFYYGGYWYGYDAYPYGWGYDDPVYIECDDDNVCYLYNPYHPGVRVGLTIVVP